MRAVSLRQLSVFVAVAKHLSFARAAEELHLTQPAVSMQIKELEAAVELPLFERAGRSVRLTMPGEYFLVYARRVLATMKEAGDAMAKLRRVQGGRVTIGMVSTAEYFVPRLLARFRAEHPAVEIRLSVGNNREQLVRQLRDNEVDLAVMGRPPRELDARAEPFAANPLGIIAAPEHPLARHRRVAPKALEAEPFIVREPGSGTRAAMEQFFRDQRIAPPRAMEMSSNETIKQAVIANMGLAFVSLHTVALELSVGQLVALKAAGLPLMRRWHIVNIQAKPLSPAAESFRYFILDQGESLLAKQFGKAVPVAA
ncbi:MAG: transcriptional regulator [Betaproteobacteria bacterium RIFCSPLOWO2_12_FULL_66_14]|nr:MAG: transcriptional regulator [Betaproteobacteria bacterium RIFCSPLOWO2_12_FULL_66_14]